MLASFSTFAAYTKTTHSFKPDVLFTILSDLQLIQALVNLLFFHFACGARTSFGANLKSECRPYKMKCSLSHLDKLHTHICKLYDLEALCFLSSNWSSTHTLALASTYTRIHTSGVICTGNVLSVCLCVRACTSCGWNLMESGVLKHTVACRATHTPVETHTHTGPGAIWHPVRIGRQKEVISVCSSLSLFCLLKVQLHN